MERGNTILTLMARAKLQYLLNLIKKQIEELERWVEETRAAAIEVGRGAHASPSMSGDREHSENQAIINRERLHRLYLLRDEISSALSLETPVSIQAPCFVNDKFYFVKNISHVKGVKIISENSHLGSAVLGKRVGETFSYELKDKTPVKGKIVKIE